LGDRALAVGGVTGGSSSSLSGSVGDFLSADIGTMPLLLAVETLVVFHKFCAFLGVVSLSRADFIYDGGVNIHGISSLGSGAASSSFMALVLFHSEGLVKSSACIWAVGSLFSPFAMLFLGFFGPFLEGPGGERIIGIRRYDSVKKSSFESKLELFNGAMFSCG
jgi:hypothetical protein